VTPLADMAGMADLTIAGTVTISSESSRVFRLSGHNRLPWQMLKRQIGFHGKVRLPIPTKDGGFPDDAQLDHKCTGSRN
jgi:hypothetical protein